VPVPAAGLQTLASPTCTFSGPRELTIGRAAPKRNYELVAFCTLVGGHHSLGATFLGSEGD